MFKIRMSGAEWAERRKRLGFTQEEVAEELKVTRQTVISWEASWEVSRLAELSLYALQHRIDDDRPAKLCEMCRCRLEHERAPKEDTDRVSFSEHRVAGFAFPASWWNIFEVLLAAGGRMVASETLAAQQYAGREHRIDQVNDPGDILKVHICKMREPLSRAGFAIENVWGRGYRLVDRGEPFEWVPIPTRRRSEARSCPAIAPS